MIYNIFIIIPVYLCSVIPNIQQIIMVLDTAHLLNMASFQVVVNKSKSILLLVEGGIS